MVLVSSLKSSDIHAVYSFQAYVQHLDLYFVTDEVQTTEGFK